jgi:hypothetical protein
MTSISEAHPTQPTLPPFDVMVGYEFFPLKKVCAVPPDATAFRSRGPQPNVMMMIAWDKEQEEEGGLQHARGFAKDLAKIIESTEERPPKESENDGYGNYGTCDTLLLFTS